MLKVRSEWVLTGQPDGLRQTIERVNAYAEAGAKCVFVLGIRVLPALKTLMVDVYVPVNILTGSKSEALTGTVMQELGVLRISIGMIYLHIAGHARSEGLTLVTNSVKEFERVKGLRL